MCSFPYFEPVHCSMSSSNCCFLCCIQASQEISKVVFYSHLLKNFPQFVVSHTVRGFSIVNEAEYIFSKFLCFFYILADVGNLVLLPLPFSKSLYIWKLLIHTLLKPSMKGSKPNLANVWNEHNCTVVWTFFGIALLWDWNENGPFLVLWPLLSFPNLLAYWVQQFNSTIF